MELAQSFYDITTDKSARGIDYQTIINYSIPFADKDFPPNLASLLSAAKSARGSSTFMYFSDITWLKPNDIFDSGYELFINIDPSRIVQGCLGDCYFLSAVSALAEREKRVRAIFVTKEANDAGCYVVQVYVSGCLQTVVLDDAVPCRRASKVPAFTRSLGNELWVLLLEKAWAKVNENYENVEAGDAVEALSFLTGAPSITIKTDSKELFESNWKEILKAIHKKYIMCASAGCNKETTVKDFKSAGLSCNHTYSLLSAMEIIHKGSKVQLLKLRDPWATQNWTGNWSKNSSLWTKELKQQLNYTPEDRGIFFMEYKDYIKYFRSTVICKYHDDYYSRSFVATQKAQPYNCFAFRIAKRTKGFITIHQLEERFMREQHKDYKYAAVSTLIVQVQANALTHKSERIYKSGAETIIELALDPGDYILYARLDWDQDYVRQYCVNTYASSDFAMHCAEWKEEETLISQALKECCGEETLSPVEECECARTMFKCCSSQGFAWQYFKNCSSDDQFICVDYEAEVKGMVPIYPSKSLSMVLHIPPQEDEIVVFRVCSSEITYRSGIKVATEPKFSLKRKGNVKEAIIAAVNSAIAGSPTRAVVRSRLEIYGTKSSMFSMAQSSMYDKVLHCGKKHELRHYVKPGASAVMGACFSRTMPFTDLWVCTVCDLIVCPMCYMRDCDNYMNYPLKLITKNKSTAKYWCASCEKENTCKLNRFSCLHCGFNICVVCKRMIFSGFK